MPNAVSDFAATSDPLEAPPLGGRPYILAVGSAAPHKNTEMLVEAYSRLRTKIDQPPLLAVVGGRARGFNRTGAARSTAGVLELGRVSDHQLRQLYAHATAFAYPSLYEGFGIPPLEAQAAGTPLVVSRRRPFTDLIDEGSALWCDPEDAASIALALERVVRSPELRRALIERGAANANRYSWDDSALRVQAIVTSSGRGD